LNSLLKLKKVSKRQTPGRHPSYTDAHVLVALELVSELSLGRASLGRRLGLGEGTTRTMIRHLREEGLITVDRSGIHLAEPGLRLLERLREAMTAGLAVPETPHTVGAHNYAVVVKGAFELIGLGVEQRDAALLSGARGATTLLYDGVSLQMPGMDLDPELSLLRFLMEHMDLEAGDVVIIGTADAPTDAEIGAKTAALELLRQKRG